MMTIYIYVLHLAAIAGAKVSYLPEKSMKADHSKLFLKLIIWTTIIINVCSSLKYKQELEGST